MVFIKQHYKKCAKAQVFDYFSAVHYSLKNSLLMSATDLI